MFVLNLNVVIYLDNFNNLKNRYREGWIQGQTMVGLNRMCLYRFGSNYGFDRKPTSYSNLTSTRKNGFNTKSKFNIRC